MRSRETKKREAKIRQKAYAALTFEEKLAKLERAGCNALKQRLLLCEAANGVRWS